MYIGTVSWSTPIATTAAVQTTSVEMSTGRMPNRPMSQLVRGPATAWPSEVAASTSPAAPYDPVCCSTCSRKASIPDGNRAVSWAAMMRATPRS